MDAIYCLNSPTELLESRQKFGFHDFQQFYRIYFIRRELTLNMQVRLENIVVSCLQTMS